MANRIVRGTAALALLVGGGCKHPRSEPPAATTGSGGSGLAPGAAPMDPVQSTIPVTPTAPAAMAAQPDSVSAPATAPPTGSATGNTTVTVSPGGATGAPPGAMDAGPADATIPTTGITSGGAMTAGDASITP